MQIVYVCGVFVHIARVGCGGGLSSCMVWPAGAAGNAGVSSGVIFGPVTACQWLQMRRKGRL